LKLVKTVLPIVALALAVFFLLARPQEAAEAVQAAIGAVVGAGTAVGEFLTALAG
jgi:preprotein translocase subunit YajC